MSEADPYQQLLRTLFEMAERIEENRHGQVIADLAVMTILIDAKLVTIEQACERLELVQSVLPERYQTEQAKLRTRLLTDWLRGHATSPTPPWTPQVIQGGKDSR